MNLLLCGPPRIGKTTIIMEVLRRFQGEVSGFYTEEIREKGRRTGFRIITMDGSQGILARVSPTGHPRVGRYVVDVSSVDSIMVPALQKRASVVVIDEIGKMELFSEGFKQGVLECLDRGNVLGTIMQVTPNQYISDIKRREDVKLITVSHENRDLLPKHISREVNESLSLGS